MAAFNTTQSIILLFMTELMCEIGNITKSCFQSSETVSDACSSLSERKVTQQLKAVTSQVNTTCCPRSEVTQGSVAFLNIIVLEGKIWPYPQNVSSL